MTHGSIIGYDINAKMCQISYYNEKTQEPETVDTGIEKENNQIPLVMNYYKETWTYGRQARRMSTVRDSICVEGIWECALGNRKIEVDGQEYEGVQLLADFVKYTLNGFEEIESITFTVPEKNEDIRVLLKGIGQKLGVAKENIYVQDYKESFCHYMFNQPKELWQYEAALFYCDEDVIRAYMLRELKNSSQKSRESFVTVDKVADARMEELEAVYPVLHVEKAKAADEHFKRFIQSVFNKKMISSVFLTGDGFENNWYPNSLRVLCNGRRAFMGNNLYSKGACYTAQRRKEEQSDAPVYLDETKLTEQISVRMRVNGEEGWYVFDSVNNVYERYVYSTAGATVPETSAMSGNMLPVIILAVIIVILLIAIILMFMKLREYTGEYEEYEDDEEDDEYGDEEEAEDGEEQDVSCP